MKNKITAFILVVFFLFSGCDTTVKEVSKKPSSSGSTLEMIVISDKDVWNGITGDAVREYFKQDQPGLGQSEPMFDVRQLPFKKFNELFQKHRSLLMLEIQEDKKPQSIYKADVWSQPQFVVKLIAPDKPALKKLLEQEKEKIRQVFYKAERKRIKKAYRKLNQRDLANDIRRKMNISMVVPEGFYIAKLQKDFLWLRREPAKMSQGILIYTQPYVDTMQFYPDRILERRDSVTKKFIPGPVSGSYMSTERLLRPYAKDVKFNNEFAVELRGLWQTENYQMGGPFLNITTYDQKNKRLVTMDGFVYHPNKPKRNYLMQLDGIIHSVKFVEDKEAGEKPQVTDNKDSNNK
ncbi:MAG: DUF4837 family protein [Bacteroidales bacterium]|nr:DUF4837 family protein [Bacteroidales bacterium]